MDRFGESASTAPVVTIGVFDGVHLGHRSLIAAAQREAAGRPVVALTFDPHPLELLRPAEAPLRLATLQHRIQLLLQCGVTEVAVLAFDQVTANLSPEAFIEDVLQHQLQSDQVVVGENFRFGHRAAGDTTTLREAGMPTTQVELAAAADGQVWSSSHVRQLVAAGSVELAAQGLARWHRVEGTVVAGDQRGRELGFPTANVAWTHRAAVPASGVYAAQFVIDPYGAAERYSAAVSVGANVTFDQEEPRVEAYVLDQELELYDRHVAVDFVARLRPMRKFADVAELLAAMQQDVARARQLLAGLTT